MIGRIRLAISVSLGLLTVMVVLLTGFAPTDETSQPHPFVPAFSPQNQSSDSPSNLAPSTMEDANITDQGLAPPIITLIAGSSVRWTNQTSQTQQIEGAGPDLVDDGYKIFLPLILKRSTSSQTNVAINTVSIASDSTWQSSDIPPQGTFTRAFTQPGQYPYTLTTRSNITGLIIVEPVSHPFFLLDTTPLSRTVDPGQAATYSYDLFSVNGFVEPVYLRMTGLPAGANSAFTPNPAIPDANGQFSITPVLNTPPGLYPVTVYAEEIGGIMQTELVLLTVNPSTQPDFAIGINPASRTVQQGEAVTYTYHLTAINGFDTPVALSINNAPQGVTAQFYPNPVTPPASGLLTITAASTVSIGLHPLTVLANGGSVSQTTTVPLTVVEAPQADFLLSLNPISQTVIQGEPLSYTVWLTAQNGYDLPVTLTAYQVPTSTTATFIPNPIAPTHSSILTITTSATAPLGAHNMIVLADDGVTISHTANISLTIVAPPPQPDLIIEAMQINPTAPRENEPFIFTVTVKNQGGAGVDTPFQIDWYLDPTSPPLSGQTGDGNWIASSLSVGASAIFTTSLTLTSTGVHTLYAQVDTNQTIDETDEENNISNASPFAVYSATPTTVCGAIDADTTWTFAKSPYLVTCNITVNAGVTLTLEAGTLVKFQSSGADISVYGVLDVEGSAAQPVYITSYQDDSMGGDTNGDGSATQPALGDWRGIFVGGSLNMSHAVVQYGGNSGGSCDSGPKEAMITNIRNNGCGTYSYDAQISITQTTIANSGNTGVWNGRYGLDEVTGTLVITSSVITGSAVDGIRTDSNVNLSLTNSTVTNSGNDGIDMRSSADVIITDNTINSNGGYGLRFNSQILSPIVTGNSFVDNSEYAAYVSMRGQLHIEDNNGSGNSSNAIWLSASITETSMLPYNPTLPYVLAGTMTIAENITLTIQSGVIAKIQNNSWLEIHGSLSAQGTESLPVVFTSLEDDTYGGDINGDGSATQPAPGDWRGIFVGGVLNLDHSVVRYGGNSGGSCVTGPYGAMITNIRYTGCLDHIPDAEVRITQSEIAHSGNAGVQLGDYFLNESASGSLTIDSSQITNSAGAGIRLESSFTLSATNSVISNNGSDGIFVRGDIPATIRYSIISGNGGYGIRNQYAFQIIDARYNDWGDASGPAPYGSGNGITYQSQYDAGCDCYIITQYLVDVNPWLGKGYVDARNNGLNIPYVEHASDPVNTANGNYVYQRTDLAIPTRSLELTFSRTYNSANPLSGPLGYGWAHSYHIFATENITDETVIISYGDGRQDKFVLSGTLYLPPPGAFSVLTKTTGLFHLTTKDQAVLNFNSQDRLANIVDKNGNTTSLTYTDDRLTSVAEPAGRELTFNYDGQGRITQLSGPLGRSVGYGYDANGDMVVMTDTLGFATTYAYTDGHRLISITDANAHTFVKNTYNSEGRVAEQRDALNNLTTFVYDIANKKTVVTDARDNQTSYQYDVDLRLVAKTDALGNVISYTYDAVNNRTSVTDKRSNTTYFAYDDRGNTTVITDALASVSRMTYDERNNLLSYEDPLNHLTTYTYDANSNLIQQTDALSGVTAFDYDSLGQLTAVTDARGNITAYGYDTYGHQTIITDALDNTTTFTYDNGGRNLSETDALGRAITYTYDDANRLLTIAEELGKVTTYSYDAVGNRTTITDPRNGVTTFVYDEKDRLVNTIDPLNQVISYTYDAVNNRTSVTDPLSHTITYTYDELNRRATVADALGNTTTYQYDANSNRIQLTDANNKITQYSYDALNRLIWVTDAANGTVNYTYDAVSNRTRMVDANVHTTTYTYDELNRLTHVTDPLSHTIQYHYDTVGNRTQKIKADGTIIAYTYDALERLSDLNYGGNTVSYGYDAAGYRTAMTDTVGVTTYDYDALYRLTYVAAPTGTLSYSYDLNDNRTHLTYPDGRAITYTYDLANRLTTVTDWAARVTTYTYDAAGRQIVLDYPNSAQATYTYDEADRLLNLRHTSPVSGTIAVFTYTLDAVGNRLAMIDLDGVTTYDYDDLYRLASVTYPDSEQVTYAYDPMGNRTAMTSSVSGVITYTYDAGDRLLATNAVTFTWDENGNMTGKGSAVYTFDALDRLVQVIKGATTVQFTYNGDGVRLGKTVNGVSTDYVQDVASPLPVVVIEASAGQNSQYVYGNDLLTQVDPGGDPTFYHTDGIGSTRALSNQATQRTDAYSYDVFGAVRSHTGSSGQSFTFAGEQVDEKLGLQFLRARYYDPEVGRFLGRDPIAGLIASNQSQNRYPYTQNNPVIFVDSSGEVVVTTVIGVAILGYGLYKMTTGLIDLATTKADAYIEAKRNHLDVNSYTEENYEQREHALREATGGLFKGVVDVATTAPGTSLTGKANLSSSWFELFIEQVGSWLSPINPMYDAYLDHELGLNQAYDASGEVLSTNHSSSTGYRNRGGTVYSRAPSSDK